MSKQVDISTGPSIEPIDIDQAKLFLKIEADDEDDLIEALIAAARMNVERYLNRSLMPQTRTLTITEATNVCSFQLVNPLIDVVSVKTVDEAGIETTLSESSYTVNVPLGKVYLRVGTTPLTVVGGEKIVIEYTSGYGTGSPISTDDVPQAIRQGILHVIAHGYEHRETNEPIPPAAFVFLNPFRSVPL